jgi:hypothetical protein
MLFPLVVGCGSSTTSPSTSTTLHGAVTDPSGDVQPDSRVPIVPDLIGATADVASGNITFVVQLASRTLDRATTRVSILLDTDRDGSTGIRQGDEIGADYSLDLAAATGQAAITKADPVGCAARQSCFTPVGSTAITFGTDSMQVTVALASLGGSDGRLNFQMNSYAIVSSGTTVVFDFMPDNTLPPGRVQ